jgi:DNA-binding MarR family transcriptional regulator
MSSEGRPEGLQAWMTLCEVVDVVRVTLNRSLQRDAGLSLAENLVLCQVAMAPDARLRMVDIADLLTIGKSAVTKTVDRLEQRGLLERHRDNQDRRIVHAGLTADGAKAFARAQPVFADSVARYFADSLSQPEMRQLRRLATKIVEVHKAADRGKGPESRSA